MKLIIDSGATKAEWCYLGPDGILNRVRTPGMNFSTMTQEEIRSIVVSAVSESCDVPVSEIYLYAAGLVEGSRSFIMAKDIFGSAFCGAEVSCASDMLAAARAVCGHSEGIAAILGTGSNSCFYDGERIVRNVRSGGFILGDEGGGACLGKIFLSDYIKGLVPEPLASEFESSFQVDYMTVVEKVYRQSTPSAYLGSFAPWILSRLESNDYVRSVVYRNLNDFFERSLMRYGMAGVPVGFVGGFAEACGTMLREIAAEKGITVSRILPSPMDGLIEYHSL